MTSIDEKSYIFINYNIFGRMDLNKNLTGIQKTSEIGVFACIFGEKRSSVHQKFQKKSQFRSYSELQQDFWFKSFLLDQKYIVVYENIWFLIITRHYCSLLLIFWNFPRFFLTPEMAENSRKWAVVSSNDE